MDTALHATDRTVPVRSAPYREASRKAPIGSGLRDGFLGSRQSDLDAIWHLHSHLAMSLLSLAVLGIWAIGATLVAIRAFRRATLS